jgi:hypothetical protein
VAKLRQQDDGVWEMVTADTIAQSLSCLHPRYTRRMRSNARHTNTSVTQRRRGVECNFTSQTNFSRRGRLQQFPCINLNTVLGNGGDQLRIGGISSHNSWFPRASQGKPKYSEKKPAPLPLCPSEILHDLTQDRTQGAAVGGRLLVPELRHD